MIGLLLAYIWKAFLAVDITNLARRVVRTRKRDIKRPLQRPQKNYKKLAAPPTQQLGKGRLCKPLSGSMDLTLSDYPAGNSEYVQTTP